MSPALAAQLHLAINHLPVLGLPLGTALLASGLWRRSEEVVRAGLLMVAVTGLSAVAVYWSGLRVGDAAVEWPGVAAAAVDAHYRAAKVTAAAAVGTGLLALLAVALPRARTAAFVVLLAACVVTASAGRTAHLGGLIRHAELR